ncbi:hypothetical protein NDU88_004327 [Pleurodeles waltl]|uniref:Uncharacterized protein n=1 Tax=Pleurodeles waltl TaxID=8319 RepID=A0AAV7VGR6_PLEWA|nr:hypothetical protein NDU88_004327 [Pleurodeles waltl]
MTSLVAYPCLAVVYPRFTRIHAVTYVPRAGRAGGRTSSRATADACVKRAPSAREISAAARRSHGEAAPPAVYQSRPSPAARVPREL